MTTSSALLDTIVEGIQEKKGQNIVICNLKEIEGAITQYFIICEGQSPTQVEAIAESIGDLCRKQHSEKPVSVVGLGTNQWVAIDYVDIMVHIFLPETRQFYDLESLWKDAPLTEIANLD